MKKNIVSSSRGRYWRRVRRYALAALLIVSMLTGTAQQLAYAQDGQDADPLAQLAELLEQASGDLQDDGQTSVIDDVYGEDGSVAFADAAYGQPAKLSAAAAGAPGTGDSKSASVSGDGRFVAYASNGSNLIEGDTNGKQDIFLHDRQLGTTRRISVGSGGAQADGDSYAPYVSLDGSYVLFTSKAANLIGGDTNFHEDLFLYNAGADTVSRVASYVSGSEFAGTGSSYAISAEGRYVVYAGKAGSTGTHDIWLLDRRTNGVKIIARQNFIYETFRSRLSISADGRFIAFDSIGSKIVPDDMRTTYASRDRAVYLFDAALDEMKLISRSPSGERGNHYSYYPVISADGRYISYLSKASNIVAADTQQTQDVYVYDRLTETTELASLNGQGEQIAADAYDPSISADGRYVSFHSEGAFDPADAGRTDVYVRDRIAGTTRWVSRKASGGNADQPADRAALSSDGGTVVFETSATDMTETADADAVRDLYAIAFQTDAAAPVWPEGASVTAAAGGAYVALSWPAVPGAVWYKVMIDDRIAGITADTSFAADGLAPGTAHRYRVAAGTSGYVWSDWTPESTVTTLPSPETDPPPAVDVTVAPELGGARLSWTYPADPDIVGAKLRWRKPGGVVYESPLYPRSVAAATVPNLENGAFYEFAVVTVDGDGNRGEGEWKLDKLPDGPALVRIDVRRGTGQPAPSANARVVDMSDDGRYTLFMTDMHGLAPEDDRAEPYNSNNANTHLYLYDADRGSVMLVSSSDNGKLGNADSGFGSISGDGRYVAFGSRASNLLANTPDTNGKWDVFLLDRDVNGNGVYDEPGDTSLSKLSTPLGDGGQANGDSSDPVISADGSTIVFGTNAGNLVPTPPGSREYAVTYDTGSRELAPLIMPGGKSPRLIGQDLSADGKVIAFETITALVDDDTNDSSDIYWYDGRDPEHPHLVWLSGLIDNLRYAGTAHMDASGRHVVFNAIMRDNAYKTYVFDAEAPVGAIPEPLIEVPAGSPMTLDYMTATGISDDGRHVLFGSSGKHIVPGDADDIGDLFLWDRTKRQAAKVSVPYDPSVTIIDDSLSGILSGDGTRAAYQSPMMNMVRGSERTEYGLYVQRVPLAAPAASWPPGSSLTASDVGRSSVKLIWEAATSASGGYRITGGPAAIEVPAGTLETVLTGLTPDSAYTFTVQASSAGGVWTADGPSADVRTLPAAGLADLTITAQGTEIRLVWGDPEEGSGIAAFHVVRKQGDGEWETLAMIDNVAARTYTDRSALSGRTYTYAVLSLDPGGTASPYSVEKTIAVGSQGIDSFTYTMPLYLRQYAGQDDRIALRMAGEAGAQSEAELVYTDSEGIDRTVTAELTESGMPGIYTGELSVPRFAAQLGSIKGKMEAEGRAYEKEALRQPIPVGATVIVELTGNDELPEDSPLTMRSASARAYQTTVLNGRRTIEFKGMPAANDYTFTLIGAGGIDLLAEHPQPLPPLGVRAGDRNEIEAELMLPARLEISVMHERGTADGVGIVVVDEDGRTIATGLTPPSGQLSFPFFRQMIGKSVTITAIPSDPVYAPIDRTITLKSGSQLERIQILPQTDAAIEGTVVDPDGMAVRGATVQVYYRGSELTAVTDDSGGYSLAVPAGSVELQVSIDSRLRGSWTTLTTTAGQTLRHDFRFSKPVPAVIKLNMYTEDVNGAWVGPYALDWLEYVHFHINTTGNSAGAGHPLLVYAEAGDKVNVCANGYEGGYSSGCVEVVIGEDLRAEAELRLERLRSNVDGSLTESPASLTVYALEAGGGRRYVSSRTVSDSRFSIDLPGGGLYELRVQYSNSGATTTRTFELSDNDAIDLGELSPEPTGAFARQPGNYVLLGTANAVPGTSVTVRAGYRNGSFEEAGSASVRLDVPAGSTLVSGSVVRNGRPATPTESNGAYMLDLGNVQGQGAGTLQYALRLPNEWAASSLDVSPRIRYSRAGEQVEEELGFATAVVAQVTLTAPDRTAFRKFKATGTAPAGSRVVVYAGDAVVGAADTTSAGRWSITTAMAGEGSTDRWQLRAVAALGDQTWSSVPRTVDYDERYAEPIKFTLQQSDGRKIELDPREGLSRFPYVFAPGRPFVLAVAFNHPNRVRDVAFYIGDTRVEASLKNGVHTALLSGIGKPGEVGIDYRVLETPTGWDGRVPPSAEIRGMLPPAFRDAEMQDLTVSPRSPDGSRQSMSYTGKLPGSSGDVDMTVTASLERTTYTPTAADLRLAEETGIPLYGLKLRPSLNNGVLRIELTGYLEETAFRDGLNVGEAMSLLAAGADAQTAAALRSAGSAGKSAEVRALSSGTGAIATRVVVFFGKEQGANTWKTIDAAYSIYDGRGSGDILDRLAGLMDRVARYCDRSVQERFYDEIDSFKNQLIAVELTKAAIMVAGAVAGPATFGIGTVALFLVSNMTGKVLDAQLQGMIDQLEIDINNHPYCDPVNASRLPKKRIADPEWIYDPSGYVYEVSPDNRIEGVQATALRWNEETDRWEVWDADWYGQDNPLYTDANGRYAWDVPEGKWKVRYEKEGYLPAESAELTVLPPHFDVNIKMVSTLPAKPVKVEAAPGGAYVDILFDRHVDGDAVSGGLLAVTDNGSDVPGAWAVLGPVTDGDSRRIRFTPESPLASGTYQAYVDGALPSYAGIPLGEPYEAAFEVANQDTTPPAQVLELAADVDSGSALVTWKLPGDPGLSRLAVAYRPAGSGSEPTFVELPELQTYALLGELAADTSYDVEVRAYDTAGNYSTERVTIGTAGEQPKSGDIAPPGPVSVGAVTLAASSIGIAWTDPTVADLSAVMIQWARRGEAFAAEPVAVAKGAGRYTITGLKPSTAYEIAIWTVDTGGNASPPLTLFADTTAAGGMGNPGNPGSPGNPGTPGGSRTERAEVGADDAELRFFGGAFKLWLPKGAAGGAKEIAVTRLAGADAQTPGGLRRMSDSYEWKLEPKVGRLSAAGKLTIAYDKSRLRGADIRKLGLYRQDPANRKRWIYVGGIVDDSTQSVAAEVKEPGVYSVWLAEPTFRDLANHWSRADVEALAARGIVSGDPDGVFRPDERVTRAEFVKLLLPLIGAGPAKASGVPSFNDVPAGAWYAEIVIQAAGAGIVQGEGGRFRPDDPVTRQEMAVMLFRALGVSADIKLNVEQLLDSYTDGERIAGWARLQVAYAVQTGLLKGRGGGNLWPDATATRAEAAIVVLRALDANGFIMASS